MTDSRPGVGPLDILPPHNAKTSFKAVQEDLVDALSAMLKARDTLRSVSDALLAGRSQASPWQAKTGSMAALAAAQLDEQIEAVFAALRSVRAV